MGTALTCPTTYRQITPSVWSSLPTPWSSWKSFRLIDPFRPLNVQYTFPAPAQAIPMHWGLWWSMSRCEPSRPLRVANTDRSLDHNTGPMKSLPPLRDSWQVAKVPAARAALMAASLVSSAPKARLEGVTMKCAWFRSRRCSIRVGVAPVAPNTMVTELVAALTTHSSPSRRGLKARSRGVLTSMPDASSVTTAF